MEDLPAFYRPMSLRLSRVLGDIGVNSWMVRRRRRNFLMIEASNNINFKLYGLDVTSFYFGSQTEGTTTPGLNSDTDLLASLDRTNIMSLWSEWEVGSENYLMVKEETCSPQHYLLQEIRPDSPEPAIFPSDMLSVVDSNGRVFHSNMFSEVYARQTAEEYNCHYFSSGPSHSIFKMYDYVCAYWCKSLPPECHEWFERPRPGDWPTPTMIRDVRGCGCFVLPDGHFDSCENYMEWRISPSLIERTLMFSMKTLQLKCYVVLKILKSHVINPCLNNNGKLTSFHCKTALFFAAERLPPVMWKEDCLMECIVYCLKLLLGWTNTGMCPHYIVAGVNLFHGKFTNPQLANLSKILSKIIDNNLAILAHVQADELGNRIVITHIRTVRYSEGFLISTNNSSYRWLSIFAHFTMNIFFEMFLSMTSDVLPDQMSVFVGAYLQTVCLHARGLPLPLKEEYLSYTSKPILSVLASTAASCCIRKGYVVPRNVLTLFESSLDADVASSRLKLASFLVCHNELEKAADVLNDVERIYDDSVQAVCGCGRMGEYEIAVYKSMCSTSVVDNDDVLLTNKTTLCVRFLRQEVFCAPPILRYDMVRGIGEDIHHRNNVEIVWMNWAVVDAKPFLFYLQYLTFRGLGQRHRQVQAFNNLENCSLGITFRSLLHHPETCGNLLGHCMEMEGQPEIAFLLYRISVALMPWNNSAHWHIYRLNHGYEV